MTKYTKAQKLEAYTDLEKLIADAVEHWTKARDKSQEALVGICSYAKLADTKDHLVPLVNSLIDGMGDGINANAMRQWAVDHLGMHLNKESKMVAGKKAPADFDTKAAAAVKWWTLAPQKPYVFDLNKAVQALLVQAQGAAAKAAKKGGESRADVDSETLQQLEQLAAIAKTRQEVAEVEARAKAAEAAKAAAT